MVSFVSSATKRLRVALAAALAAVVATFAITFADPVSPITLTKVDSPDPVASGAQLTYTITAVNTGGSKLTNIVLTDQLNNMGGIGSPPQFVLTSTRGTCTQNVSLITCNAGTIEGNGTWVVTIRGVVTAPAGTTINNTASVSGTRSAQNFTTTATATTLVSGGAGTPMPDLTITKTGPTSVAVSSPMTYTLTVNNQGTANATDIEVSDTLPVGLSSVTFSTTSLFSCLSNEPTQPITVTCTGGAVNFGSNGTITINATSPATNSAITNTASVDPNHTIAESNELNNTSALVNTQVGSGPGQSALTIDKTDTDSASLSWDDGAGPDPVVPGQTLTYKILVKNTGATRADDVMLVDGTTGLEASSITINQVVTNGTVGQSGGCSVTAPQAKCLARTLNPGGTILYTVTGQVVASAGSTIINTATVTGNIRNVGVSSTDTELTTVRPAVDLTITKTGPPAPVCASSWPTTAEGSAVPAPASPPLLAPPACLGGLKYTMVIGNSGTQAVSGVVVRDELPGGTIFDHISGNAYAPADCVLNAGNVLICSGGTLGGASTKTLNVFVVAPPVLGPITNRVFVDPANAIFEADETNNFAIAGTTIATGVDLTIVKFDSAPGSPDGFDPIATSGTQTYIIKVQDIGPQSASNIMVRDTLPAGTVFRSATGDHGFSCSQTSPGVVDCVGGSLPGTFDEFYSDTPTGEQKAVIAIKVFAQPIVGTMHNEVRVDPLNQIPEINENNNLAVQDTTVQPGGSGTGAFNEFSITKTQTKPLPVGMAVARNAKMTFDIKVKNDGTDPAVGVVVRDFLPAGAQFIAANGSNHFLCSQVSNYIECVGGELGKIGSGTEEATLTIAMFAPDTPGHYVNQAIVDPLNALPEGNEFNNQVNAQFDVTNGGIGAWNDLTITKSPKTGTVKPKDPITYTLTVKNLGEAPALNVAVRDVLPAGVTFVSAQDKTNDPPGPVAPGAFTCSEAGGVINCTGATLDGVPGTLTSPDVPDTRTIIVKVTAPDHNVPDGGLINQATVDPNNTITEGDETNNFDDSRITVASAIDLRIEKNGPTESDQNQVTQYTLTVYNDKADGTGQDAIGVVVHDPLPVGLIPLSVFTSDGSDFTCTVNENPINLVECIGDIPKGEHVTITIDVFMTAEGSRKLDNEACVDPGDTIEESNELNNCSTATTLGGSQPKKKPDLLVSKSVSPSGPITSGQALTYTVSISNVGDAKAAGELTLTDNLPGHVTFVNYTATNGWSCTFTSPNLVCHDGDDPANPGTKAGLDVGASASITIQATYDGGATAPIVNTATAATAQVDGGESDTQENEKNQANNTAFTKNSVGTTGIDLVVSKIVDQPDPVAIGGKLTYIAIVVNGGTEDSTTSGHQVKVQLNGPVNGVIFLSATGSNGFNCGTPDGSGEIDCTGDLPAGGDTTLTVEYTVVAGTPADQSITVIADPGLVITETNEGNNTLTETTTVAGDSCAAPSPCIDLVAAQLVGTPEVYVNNGTVTMSFILVNVGDSSTTLDPTVPGNPVIDPKQPLAYFDVSGTHTGSTRTVTPTNPATVINCIDFSNTASSLLSNCYGNLGPGEGVKITVTFTGVTSNSVSGSGTADPLDLVAEFLNSNNSISKTVIKQ